MTRRQIKSTKYLTGQPKSFFEPEQSILAKKRIEALKMLMTEISARRVNNMLEPDDAHRYIKAETAIEWWTALLEEE